MLNIMKILRKNIPHPHKMDFLLYLSARKHPRVDDFIENILLMEMKQDLVFRSQLGMCVIDGNKITLHIKRNTMHKHGFRIQRIAERTINRVYRGLPVVESGPFGREDADIVYDSDRRYSCNTVTLIISSPSPIEYYGNELSKQRDSIRREMFDDALSITSRDFGLSDVGEDFNMLLSELDDTTRKIDREISGLVKKKQDVQAIIGDVSRYERSLRVNVANDYVTLTGELDERMSRLDQEIRFFEL